MTAQEVSKLTNEQLRLKVAELHGMNDIGHWDERDGGELRGFPPSDVMPSGYGPYYENIPDYPNDLNAMHETIASMDDKQKCVYRNVLVGMHGLCSNWEAIDSTARQRAEAFVMAMEGI